MKYRLTPLNLFCAFLVGVEIIFFAFPESIDKEPYGYQHVILIPVIVIGISVDSVLQKMIKKYSWLFLIQVALIVITVLLNIDF